MAETDRHAAEESFQAALRLFDETTRALEARSRRLEEVLTVKQRELLSANETLADKLAELDRVHAWLELLLAAVPSAVLAVDRDGQVTTLNRAARILMGHLLGDDPAPALREQQPDSPLWQVLELERAQGPYERRLPGPDGRPRTLSGRCVPIRDPDGSLVGAVEVLEDVTGLRSLEEQLERAERLKALGEMAAGVAHEIRNPLNGMKGFASLLARDLPEGSAQRRYAQAIVEGTSHLDRTVADLLAFTRQREPERRRLEPVELVQSCIELLRAEAPAANRRAGADPDAAGESAIAIEVVDRWGEQGPIPADPNQLRQVLVNLVQNAQHILREAEIGGPRIVVTVEYATETCRILVDDNGPGVDPDLRARIFTPFFTTRAQGTGLGLAVAHSILALHGGALTVEDAPIGGARFALEFPIG